MQKRQAQIYTSPSDCILLQYKCFPILPITSSSSTYQKQPTLSASSPPKVCWYEGFEVNFILYGIPM